MLPSATATASSAGVELLKVGATASTVVNDNDVASFMPAYEFPLESSNALASILT